MALGTKVSLGFAVPLSLIVALTIGVLVASKSVESDAELAKNESAVFAGIARQMKFDVVQVQQWLTDISATRGLDGLDDGFDEAEKSTQSFLGGVAEFKRMYQEENDSSALREMTEIEDAFEAYYEAGKTMANAYIEGGPAAGNQQMAAFDEAAMRLVDMLDPFVDSQTEEFDAAMQSVLSSAETLASASLTGGLIGVISSLLCAWLITRSINRNTVWPIKQILEGMAEGSDQVASASSQVSSASQSLAEGASEQAAGIEETSSSLEEMSSMTQQNADNADLANTTMAEAKGLVDQGQESMGRLNTAIEEIKTSADETAKIVKTIDEIASQTNLLALNAAGEAARDTADLIKGSVKNADRGVNVATETAQALEALTSSSEKVQTLVAEIAAASKEQAKGIEQVNSAVTQMDNVTQQNAANAEESASASEELSAQAEQMRSLVGDLAGTVGAR
jgi:methyl-accepting chemotaxis protein